MGCPRQRLLPSSAGKPIQVYQTGVRRGIRVSSQASKQTARILGHKLWSRVCSVLLNYIYGEEWKNLFRVVLTLCGKPTFYTRGDDEEEAVFKVVDCNDFSMTPVEAPTLDSGNLYYQGNAQTLMNVLAGDRTNEEEASERVSVCYVGDHLFGDVTRSHACLGWLPIAIVDELVLEKVDSNPCCPDHGKLSFHDFWGQGVLCGGGERERAVNVISAVWQHPVVPCVRCLAIRLADDDM